MNIYDISKKAGVSIATVSRVLNNNPNVSEKTKQKVHAVMEEASYTPNIFARGLSLNSMHSVGLLCGDSSDLYLAEAVYHLEQALRKNGYDSLLCCTGYDLEGKQKGMKLLLSKRVDAIILVGSTYVETDKKNHAYIQAAAAQIPILIINGFLKGDNIFCTLCDDYQAMYDAATHLIRLGAKHTLYLYRMLTYSGKQKIDGFKAALSNHNIPLKEPYLLLCPKGMEETKELLLTLSISFDSILASDDSLAMSALKYAKAAKLCIPKDLQVIGCNNSILSKCCEPELTSLDNKVEALCNTAVSTLIHHLQGGNVPSKILLSADLIERETTLKTGYFKIIQE